MKNRHHKSRISVLQQSLPLTKFISLVYMRPIPVIDFKGELLIEGENTVRKNRMVLHFRFAVVFSVSQSL